MRTGIILILIIVVTGSVILWRHTIKIKGEKEFYLAKKLYEEKRFNESFLAFDSLIRHYRRAIWLGEATYYGAKNLNLLGRDIEAKKYWQRLKDRYGDVFHADEVTFYMGRGYEAEGNIKEAESHYQRVLRDFSASPLADEALYGLGRIYEREGKLENAVETFEKVARNSPESRMAGEALLSIATLYEKKEEWKKSLDLYYRLRKDFPESGLALKAEDGIGRINIRLIISQYPAEDSFVYKVETGDSLNSIAQKFNTTIELIKDANALSTATLMPGQRLKLLKSKFRIKVSKEKNRLYLENNGKFIKVYNISTGKDNSTPEGKFTIVNKIKDPPWYTPGAIIPPGSPENILGSRWLGLSEKGYGLHGANNPEDIGKYVTNGCIRLVEEDIQELYKLVPVGTEVEIH